MAEALDIRSRTNSLNDKITYASEVSLTIDADEVLQLIIVCIQVQSVLRELLTEVSESVLL